ncbi:MAG: hypothetical protein ACE5KZ_14980 [Candidatus Scalinduaceae bacterium]
MSLGSKRIMERMETDKKSKKKVSQLESNVVDLHNQDEYQISKM